MKLKTMLTAVCCIALGSNADIVYGQEQDASQGIGIETSEPPESVLVAPVVTEEIAIDNNSHSLIGEGLQEKLDQMRGKDTIEVVIYLDIMIDEEENEDGSELGSSGNQAYFSDTYDLNTAEVTTTDPYLNYAMEGLPYDDKLALVDQRRSQRAEKRRIRRTEKSKRQVNRLLKKLRKKRFNRLISFDESAGIIIAKLKKREIKKLSRFPEYILSITPHHEEEATLLDAFNDMRLNTTSWPVSTYGGQGVGIFMRESNGRYCFDQNKVRPIESTIGLGGGNYTEDRPTAPSSAKEFQHAESMAQALRAASPRSHIYCSNNAYSLPSAWRSNIHIVNYSWVKLESDSTTAWDSVSERADTFSYNDNVQIFAATGNECENSGWCSVASPAKSHNALSVGAYDHNTNKMGVFSAWRNPSTGARKPEIVAPGVGIDFAANVGSNEFGTSISTPLAAGMAASNISLISAMKKRPALIKASMLAMATKTDISNNGDVRLNGARGIRWNPDGFYSWWDRPHTFLDDASGQWKLLQTYNLRQGENARIALSWMNRAEVCNGSVKGRSYTPPSSRLCLGLAMKVVDPNGRQVVYQNAKNQNWQAANFYTSSAGNYKVYVWRTSHYFEWSKKYAWSSKKYHYNRAKLGLRVAYIDNW